MWKTTPVRWTSTPTTLHKYILLYKPRPGGLSPGESHRRNHRLPLYLRLYSRQQRPPAPAVSLTTTSGAILYVMRPGVTRGATRSHVPSPVATFNLKQPRAFSRPLPEEHSPTAAQARISRGFGLAHQLDVTALSTEYAYATTNTQGNFSAGR